LINADFILPSSREDIQDVQWNRWLMKCVAELVAKSLRHLKEKCLLTVNFLEKFARRLNQIAEDKGNIFYPIFTAVSATLKEEELIPSSDGSFVSGRNAKLARGADLRDLLTYEQLRSLFKTTQLVKWVSSDITQDKTPALRRYLIDQLGIEEIRPDRFVELLTDDFLENQSDKWMINFYSFLGADRPELWKKPDASLRRKKIIRLEDNSHVIPFKNDGTPNAYLPSVLTTNFPTIKRSIAADENASDFLKKLGIIEPDLFAEIIEFIIPKYEKEPITVDYDTNIDDLRKIKKLVDGPPHGDLSSSLAKVKILLGKLDLQKYDYDFANAEPGKIIPLLLNLVLPRFQIVKASNRNNSKYKAPGDTYKKNDLLNHYFENNPDVWFIADDYPDELSSMLQRLGVHDSPKVTKRNADNNGFIPISNSRQGHRRGLKGFDPDIEVEGLSNALSSPTIEKSAFIWNKIAIPNAECIRGTVEKSSRKTYENSSKEECVSKSFGRLLIEKRWLPGKDGEFHRPSEIGLNELPEQFERNEKLADLLGMKKDIVAKLAEEAGIKPEILKCAQALEEYPDLLEEILEKKRETVKFPTKPVRNPDRRQERFTDQFSESPKKEYEERERSVRTTRDAIDPSPWLREQYTNDDGQMVCQICKKEMPFKKRDGEYYFEAVEAFTEDIFSKEHEAQFLALCPLCAAMYKELVKKDKTAMADLRKVILNMDTLEAPLRLDRETTIKFVESHLFDIKTILKAVKGSSPNRQ